MTQRRWTWQQKKKKALRALSTKTGRDPISCPHFQKCKPKVQEVVTQTSALSGPSFSNILRPLTPNSGSSWIIHADLWTVWMMSLGCYLWESPLCYLPIISTARLSASVISLRQLLLKRSIHPSTISVFLPLSPPALISPAILLSPYLLFSLSLFNLSRDTPSQSQTTTTQTWQRWERFSQM